MCQKTAIILCGKCPNKLHIYKHNPNGYFNRKVNNLLYVVCVQYLSIINMFGCLAIFRLSWKWEISFLNSFAPRNMLFNYNWSIIFNVTDDGSNLIRCIYVSMYLCIFAHRWYQPALRKLRDTAFGSIYMVYTYIDRAVS